MQSFFHICGNALRRIPSLPMAQCIAFSHPSRIRYMRCVLFVLSYFFCALLPETGFAAETKYILAVRVSPETHAIDVQGSIENLPRDWQSSAYINQSFVLDELGSQAGVNDIKAAIDVTSDSPPYTEVAKRLVPSSVVTADRMFFKYHGTLLEKIGKINMIDASLIELASYSAWFPFFKNLDQFEYDVHLSVPKTFVVTSNGVTASQSTTGKTVTYHFTSAAPGRDIVLVGAPSLERNVRTVGGLTIEMYRPTNSRVDVDERLDAATQALQQATAWFGEASSGLLRMVYSPRSGSGYSRLPLFVVSDEYAGRSLPGTVARQQAIQGDLHELSHFWWRIADVQTPEDWINEGLAEYTSFSLATAKFGEPLRRHLLQEYVAHAAKATSTVPIDQTDAKSPVRYVNRYEKAALTFYMLELQYGREPLLRALHALYQEFKGTRSASTARLESLIKQHMGSDAAILLKEYVSTPWTDERLNLVRATVLALR